MPFRSHKPGLVGTAALAALLAMAACGDPAGPADETPPGAPKRVGSVSFGQTALRLSSLGEIRVAVTILDRAGQPVIDTITPSITTTGPFFGMMESGEPPWFRILRITTSGPGTGKVTLTADGVSASVDV